MNARWLQTLVLATALALAPIQAASAHEGEERPAKTLIEQAIALIRGQPDQLEAIEDKIHDALEAEDTRGVDLELVERADEALEAGDLHEAQDLLESSIGAAPHEVVESPNPEPGEPAPEPEEEEAAAEPSPVLHETALEGSDQDLSGGPVLFAAALVLGLVGLVIVRRAR